MGVAEAQARISSAEFAEWIAYDRIDPIGPEREDLRAAIGAATTANYLGRKRRKVEEFMVRTSWNQGRRQDPATMRAVFEAFARAHNARIGA